MLANKIKRRIFVVSRSRSIFNNEKNRKTFQQVDNQRLNVNLDEYN